VSPEHLPDRRAGRVEVLPLLTKASQPMMRDDLKAELALAAIESEIAA